MVDPTLFFIGAASRGFAWWEYTISFVFLASFIATFVLNKVSGGRVIGRRAGSGTDHFILTLILPFIVLGCLGLWIWGKLSGRGNIVIRQAVESPLMKKLASFVPFLFWLLLGLGSLAWGYFDKAERIRAWFAAFWWLLFAAMFYPHDGKPKN